MTITTKPSHAQRPPGDALGRRLRPLFRPAYRAHDRRVGRLVVAYRDRRGRDLRDAGPITFEDLRLVVLSYSWGPGGRDEPSPRSPLATYRPRIDPAGSGRVLLSCCSVRDAGETRIKTSWPDAATEAAALHEAAEDADEGDRAVELPLPRIYYAYEPRRPPRFGRGGVTGNGAEGEVEIEGLRAWSIDRLIPAAPERDLGAVFASAPAAIYADVAHLMGRRVRNPAYEVLCDRGVLGVAADYAAWSRGLELGDDRSANNVAIQEAVDSHAATLGDGRVSLHRAVEAACVAVGVPLIGGGDSLASLLKSPWGWCQAPGVGRAQVLRLSGPPGPDTATFATPQVQADLGSLEAFGARYRAVPRGIVTAWLDENARHARRPPRGYRAR